MSHVSFETITEPHPVFLNKGKNPFVGDRVLMADDNEFLIETGQCGKLSRSDLEVPTILTDIA
jgi:hypothetical protein